MAKQRKTLRAEDLVDGAHVRWDKNGGIYRLGPPKKKNVNMNVVNHCQLYRRNGELLEDKWLNLSNLRKLGFKFFKQEAGAQLDILLSKRALQALSFQERVSICDEAGVHFSYLEAVLEQPGNQQSSLTATAFLQVVQLAAVRHESVAKVLKGGEQV